MSNILKKFREYRDSDASNEDFYRSLDQDDYSKIYLDALKINNYRGFKEILLNNKQKSKLIGFVGDNAAGKTTLLNAIRMTLTWLVNSIRNVNSPGERITEDDIKNEETMTEIRANFNIHKDNVSITLAKTNAESKKNINNEIKDIKDLGAFYSELSKNNKYNLPLIAFYNVSGIDDDKAKKPSDKYDADRINVYNQSISIRSGSTYFLDQIKALDDIINQDKVKLFDEPDNVSLKNKIEKNEKIKNIVFNAIKTFTPDIKEITINRDNIKNKSNILDFFKIKKSESTFSFKGLSQGELSLVTLVGDLAYRAVHLNQEMDNPLASNGIVLIDEIDLHLHPKWQMTVINQLTNTFPNIQFIFTTHSPLVISNLDDKNIYALENFNLNSYNFGLKGADITRVLKQLFNLTQTRADVEESRKLERYQKLVSLDQWDTEDAKKLCEELRNFYDDNEPLLDELDTIISIKEWEKSYAQDT